MKKSLPTIFFLLSIAFSVTPRLSFANDCTVTSSADSGSGSLRDCIENVATSDGNTITIEALASPIKVTGSLTLTMSINIRGAGPTASIIDGSAGNARVFNIPSTVNNKSISISGVTIQGVSSSTQSGLAILLDANDSTLNLSDCEIKNMTSSFSDNGAAVAVF
ncbi:MAG TPA: hypothetical protein DF383_12510, partial [Deltaproteobacteria bacterium]|nr:hypothetical protein [Deltaproteobacteria bacterium]